MILDYFNNENFRNLNIKRLEKTATVSDFYRNWFANLYERIMRLFVYEGLPLNIKELDERYIMNGSAIIKKIADDWIPFYCSPSKQSKYYYDEFDKWTINSPTYSSTVDLTTDDVFLAKNNSLHYSFYPLLHRYALMLAHVDVSIISTLVTSREKGVPIGMTAKEVNSITEYYKNLYNGKYTAIQDESFSGVEFRGFNDNIRVDLTSLMECRRNLLYNFYEDIGVKTNYAKRGNMTDDEVNASDGLYMFNLSDMLANRQELCDWFNSKGYNCSVKLNPSINLELNEPKGVLNDV